MPWVMDCSIAAALGLPDENSEKVDSFLQQITNEEGSSTLMYGKKDGGNAQMRLIEHITTVRHNSC